MIHPTFGGTRMGRFNLWNMPKAINNFWIQNLVYFVALCPGAPCITGYFELIITLQSTPSMTWIHIYKICISSKIHWNLICSEDFKSNLNSWWFPNGFVTKYSSKCRQLSRYFLTKIEIFLDAGTYLVLYQNFMLI